MNKIDLTGKIIGSFKVIRFSGILKRHYYWICVCLKCGREVSVDGGNLRSGKTSQCLQCFCKSSKKHGHAHFGRHTKTYTAWQAMLRRCDNPNNKAYKWYGGRGINVCDRWKTYAHFLKDMGESPKGMSLDRINNDGNYEPGNCRWTTRLEQSHNRSDTKMVLYNGKRMPVSVAERETGRCKGNLSGLLRRYGWPDVDISIIPKPVPHNFLKKHLASL